MKFVSNRALSWLLFVVAFSIGVFGFIATPKSYNPKIEIASFTVISQYPGATAAEVEQYLTTELEQVIADLDGIDTMESRSIDGGAAIITTTFEVGRNIEDTKIEFISTIQSHSDLFENLGLPQPVIKVHSPDTMVAATFGFTSDTLNQNEVRTLVQELANRITEVPNIANIQVWGGEVRALRILLDPGKLKLRKVSPADVIMAIRASNIKYPVGSVSNNETLTEIEVVGTFENATQAGEILVAPGVKLSDVGIVEDSFAEKDSALEIYQNGQLQDLIQLTFGKVKGENVTDVTAAVNILLEEEFKKEKYNQLSYEVYRDDGMVAAQSTEGLFNDLMTSVSIVILVLLLFLQVRPALTVGFAIPLALALSFFVGYLSGQTVNKVSVFAFILALGLLVDSATVVVENCHRHIQLGEPKFKAIISAVNEVGSGLLMSTITSVIVFLPMGAISGMMGEYIAPMAFFVPVALISSLLLAFTITPFLSSVILKKRAETQKKPLTERFLDKITNGYTYLLKGLLAKKSRQVIFIFFVILALVGALACAKYELFKKRSVPDADMKQMYVYIDAPFGTSLVKTHEISKRVAGIIGDDENVNSIQVYTALAPIVDLVGTVRDAAYRSSPHQSTMKINFKHQEDRETTTMVLIQQFRRELLEDSAIQKYRDEGSNIRVLDDAAGPPTEAAFVARVKGPNVDVRNQIANDIERMISSVYGSVHVDSTVKNAARRIFYQIDHDKALASGVTAYDIAQALNVALGPYMVSQYHLKDQLEPAIIQVQFEKENRDEVSDLSQIYVKNIIGQMLPIDSIVNKIETRNEPVRYRHDRDAIAKVTAHISAGSINHMMKDFKFILENEYVLPYSLEMISSDTFGYDYKTPEGDKYRIEWGGEWEQALNVDAELMIAMIIAFLIVYMVLIYQFSSFSVPLIIMSTVPLGLIGIYPGFVLLWYVGGIYMSSTALIGLIALIGIVVNNSIMFIEYFDILRDRGLEVKEALIEAGHIRLRPIMLTSITTICGTLTIAFDPVWAGLAWSVIFGLGMSVSITVFLIPVLYNLIQPSRGISSDISMIEEPVVDSPVVIAQ